MMMRKMVSMLLFVCMMIDLIPVIASADSGAVSQPADVRALVLKQGFSADIAEALAKLAAKRNEAMKPGIKGELIFTVAPLEIKEVNDALWTITARPELLPRRTFEELTGVPQVTVENLPKVLDALFDPADLPQWFRGENGEELPAEALKKEAAIVVSLRNNTVKRQLIKLEKDRGKQGLEDFLALFNQYKDRVVFPNREVYRSIFRKLILAGNTNTAALSKSLRVGRAQNLADILILAAGAKLPVGGIVVSCGYNYPGQSYHGRFVILNDHQLSGDVIVRRIGGEKPTWVSTDLLIGVDEQLISSIETLQRKERIQKAREEGQKAREEGQKAREEGQRASENIAIRHSARELMQRICDNVERYHRSGNEKEKKKLAKQIREDRDQFQDLYARSKVLDRVMLNDGMRMVKQVIDTYLSKVPL